MRRDAFVFSVCGDAHVERVNIALRFLKRFSRADIVVVAGRSSSAVACDQVFRPSVPSELTDHQASIYLKTMLPLLVGGRGTYCYLDSDQIATSRDVDDIFDLYRPPITFARDHSTIDQFSRFAVHCSCRSGKCDHLRTALRQCFGVTIRDGEWRHWNGGLYLYDGNSADFAHRWHSNTLVAFENAYWRVRDQGSLIVTQWQLGLQEHAQLPPTVTRIVDRYYGYSEAQRGTLQPRDYFVSSDVENGKSAFLHFINDGVGCSGWPTWDSASALLDDSVRDTANA